MKQEEIADMQPTRFISKLTNPYMMYLLLNQNKHLLGGGGVT